DDPDDVHGAGDDADVVLARSIDYGLTWTVSTVEAGPVDEPGTINNSFQLFTTAAIDPFGNLVMAWYDNRRGLTNGAGHFLLDVFAKYSTDGGLTWSDAFMVKDPSNPFDPDPGADERFDPTGGPPTTRIGEYFGLDVFGGTAYVAWNGNTFSGSQPVGQQVWFSSFAIRGSLTINGTEGDDTVVVRSVPDNPDFVEVSVNGRREYVGLWSGLTGITINGLS